MLVGRLGRTAPVLPMRGIWHPNSPRSVLMPALLNFRRVFHPTVAARAVHFDTNAFVQRLEQAGVKREQADVLVTALIDVINESLDNFSRGLVRRDEADRLTYTQKVDFAKLKSEIQLLERSDFVLMKSENERLMADVEKLKQRLREEITRTTAGVRLDLNLEKGRIRDESSVHALKIKEIDTRIESEIAGVRTSIQSAKFNVLQYLVGVATGAVMSIACIPLRMPLRFTALSSWQLARANLRAPRPTTIRILARAMQITSHEQYITDGMDASELEPTPMAMFTKWFEQATDAGVPEPEAMTLSTVAMPQAPAPASRSSSKDKQTWRMDAPRPSARVVLLKRADEDGFQFFSNYESRKGDELASNPWCSLTFYWPKIHRSVRVCGRAVRLTKEESQAYFDTRPLGSRLGAWASPQSQVIASREDLRKRVSNYEEKFHVPPAVVVDSKVPFDQFIPLPPYWGGYRVIPDEVEFWIGRTSRLHDRFRYARDPHTDQSLSDADSWTIERLAP
ncbi:pyridoxal 5'-phosphate synthase [Malassezia psittaci]|uniref:pyridoxal 5'-phosphate synthase n=1 Tax=Malassezia psittaci TaxID=1821823 RepID=A0AAF0F594_9BASI|nr:pyridoxal 5'-phosphate synthase [Malassezia psittaci]